MRALGKENEDEHFDGSTGTIKEDSNQTIDCCADLPSFVDIFEVHITNGAFVEKKSGGGVKQGMRSKFLCLWLKLYRQL